MNCCRICLIDDLTNQFPSIFAEEQIFNGIYRIFDAVKEICPSILKLSSVDCLPKKICWNCLQFCKNSFVFKKNCEKSDKLFREILKEHREELPANSAVHHDNYKITKCPLLHKNLVIVVEKPSIVDLNKEDIDDVVEEKIEIVVEKLTVQSYKDRRRYNCEKCPKTFKSLLGFNYHQKNTHRATSELKSNERFYQCTICLKRFTTSALDALKDHINSHQNLGQFECEICKEDFNTKLKLNAHKLCHTKKKSRECNFCGKVYVSRGALKNHLSSHIGKVI